eukprot:scaffold33098_cov21-Prasinocladus_malaysianus.AAC.1
MQMGDVMMQTHPAVTCWQSHVPYPGLHYDLSASCPSRNISLHIACLFGAIRSGKAQRRKRPANFRCTNLYTCTHLR